MSKISALSALAAASMLGTALVPVVDPSDVSMGPTGTTKKMLAEDLRKAIFNPTGAGWVLTDPIVHGAGTVNGDFSPGTDNTYKLGTASFRWSDVRANTGTFSGALAAASVAINGYDSAFVKLGEHILGAPGSSLEVTSIPSGYKSIRVVCYLQSNVGGQTFRNVRARFNGVSTANYYATLQDFDGAVMSASTDLAATSLLIGRCSDGAGLGTFSQLIFEIAGYDAARAHALEATSISLYNTGGNDLQRRLSSCGWNNGSAITQITLVTNAFSGAAGDDNWATGSRMHVYGLR